MKERLKRLGQVSHQVSVHQQIMTELLYLLITVLLGSVIVKVFVYDQKAMAYVTELICLGLAVVYTVVRHVRLGVKMTLDRLSSWNLTLFSSLLLTVIFGIFYYYVNERQYVNPWELGFLSVVGTFFLAVLLIQLVIFLVIHYRKRQKKAAIKVKDSECEESVAKDSE
ncbi:DUF6773 family protein [Streptococcus merionis]|uniref:Uncharacterized protein n=1 Tax=Streptococcus merionis TaxID=400065 RepID=A0A239SLI5_9STRE|nr:DUF6773 family protein [Streptococcus merionis]SNU86295.1 Uncharacterised protein [Streptococcus merionis]